jgi:hypothetical protein
MKKSSAVQLAALVDTTSPAAVFEEVKNIFVRHYPIAAFGDVRAAFRDFNALFDGHFPGYRACNTRFHDKVHTSDALLAMARLIDGYNLRHQRLPVEPVRIALVATLFHDAGYIQRNNDKTGTGAKYTLNHVQRSIDFMEKYFAAKKWGRKAFLSASRMVQCTGFSTSVETIPFADTRERVLGRMLGAADILGQMSSRTYLERLLHLFLEFQEGRVPGYKSEYELLQKTLEFYAATRQRFAGPLGGVDRYAAEHFKARYGINEDLYRTTIQRQIDYLKRILGEKKGPFRTHLRRHV